MYGILLVLTIAVTPALDRSVIATDYALIEGERHVQTYHTPILIATATPTFSLFFICSFQIIVHGSIARVMSIAAEYAAHVSE
jgi:hypothetical protein